MLFSMSACCLVGLVLFPLMKQIESADFIFGGEAKRVCEAYKRICPAKKICALQSIDWPAPMKFPVCVHEKHLVVKSRICRQAPAHGKCGAKFMRWYFNVHMGTCSWFTYSGCGGNQNNFRTSEECEARCMGVDNTISAEEMNSWKEDSNHEVDSIENAIVREPKFHLAPEEIELDTSKMRAPLEVGEPPKKHKQTKSKPSKKDQHKKDKVKKKKHPKKQKKVKKIKNQGPQSHLASPVINKHELTGEKATGVFHELRAPMVSYQRPSGQKISPVWQMDARFARGKKNNKTRNSGKNNPSRPQHIISNSGVKQDSYYDKVHMFEILNKESLTDGQE
ncbi:amyloid beta A4 protein [Biomphalaria pfeifferi]|uniref:Amyloid beta A4 protein n=1 Tax=Biomphalaria pfeifferi TaxID=112525 RepID=A0AAD8BF51_BIOPF|nr:amyloid beta A4 protein [Biomphalaria pfeifferi]